MYINYLDCSLKTSGFKFLGRNWLRLNYFIQMSKFLTEINLNDSF